MKNKKFLSAILLLGCLFSTSCNINLNFFNSVINSNNVSSGADINKYSEILNELGIYDFEGLTLKEYTKNNDQGLEINYELNSAGYGKKIIIYQNNELVGGVYEGIVLGYGGPIHFQIFFKGGVCHSFKCLSNSETPGFGQDLLVGISEIIKGKPASYFKENVIDSDFGSGCTVTEQYLVPAICRAAHDYCNILNNENIPYEENKKSYEETLFGIENASYAKVTLGALDENSNIKNVYIASVKDVETAICYELSGTTTWNTGHGEATINGTLGVSFNISDDKVLTANAIDLGTTNKFKDAANIVLSSFVGLDANTIAAMTSTSHDGIDFITKSTVTSQLTFDLVVEAANQYINTDKLVYSFGVTANFEKVENVTLPSETNIKGVYLGKVEGLNNVLGYKLEKEVEWNTGHSNAKFNSSIYVAFDLLTDKVLSAKVINGGTGSKFKDNADFFATQFVGLDATTVAGMTTSSYEGVDFIANSTVSSLAVFDLVVEAANHYINNSSLKYGVNAAFEELSTTLSANIKKAYVGKVESINKAVAYELEKEVMWDTGHSNAQFTAKAIVVIDLETEKIISLSLSDCGTANKYKNDAYKVMAGFFNLDVTIVAGMTTSSHDGIDFIARSTVTSQLTFDLVVEAAQQYVNVDKSYLR